MSIFKIELVNFSEAYPKKAGDWITFSVEDAVGLLRENGADFEDLICCDPDDEDGPEEQFMAMADYLRPGNKMGDYISSFGLKIDDGQISVFSALPDNYPALDVAERVAMSVVTEYEWRVGDDRPRPTWEMFELAGDDTVDYAGGHVTMAVDFIRAVLKLLP